MIRSYQYRFYPNTNQESSLLDFLGDMCDWYNSCLEDRENYTRRSRKDSAFKSGRRVSDWDQMRSIPELRKGLYWKRWPASAFSCVCNQVNSAYQRYNSGAGIPRFKSKSRFRTASMVPGKGVKLDCKSLSISDVSGSLRVNWHRDLPVDSKLKLIKFTHKFGKWFVSFIVDCPARELCGNGTVGVDLGLSSIVALSTVEIHKNSRLDLKGHPRIRRQQRTVSRRKPGSNRKRKAQKIVSNSQSIIRAKQIDFAHKLARRLVRENSRIAFEDLDIKRMVEGRKFSRSIMGSAWGRILAYTTYKAESAGGTVVLVDPRHTSQTCPDCGRIEKKPLSLRRHRCGCGADYDRDVAAAIVIRDRAFPRAA